MSPVYTQKSEENSRKDDKKKEQILRSAFNCLSRHPIESVTMDDIAREAGISKGLIYFYFKNKDELIYDLCDFWCEENEQALLRMAVEYDLRELIYEYPKLLFKNTMMNTHYQFFLQLWSRSIEDEQLKKRLTRMHEDHRKKHIEFLRVAIKKGFLKEDVDIEVLAVLIHAIFEGLLVQWHFNSWIHLTEYWKKTMDYLLYGVGVTDTRVRLELGNELLNESKVKGNRSE